MGDTAPDFTLLSQSGEVVSLGVEEEDHGPLLLPQGRHLRLHQGSRFLQEGYEKFEKLGAEMIGISSDSVKSHQRFVEKHGLPFVLLSDEGVR
jgi:peroxiredoxin Q/BCP